MVLGNITNEVAYMNFIKINAHELIGMNLDGFNSLYVEWTNNVHESMEESSLGVDHFFILGLLGEAVDIFSIRDFMKLGLSDRNNEDNFVDAFNLRLPADYLSYVRKKLKDGK